MTSEKRKKGQTQNTKEGSRLNLDMVSEAQIHKEQHSVGGHLHRTRKGTTLKYVTAPTLKGLPAQGV